ncbi:ret finger protein-like 4B [Choloepus didactylus]|uniref:ret finger protein-like 4B n=1 Tax=Choloepus didactylus TaxID=27675 RepID=UPI0018A0D9B3|nr:ret finger protein-like 4B [Choloepus didactylus]
MAKSMQEEATCPVCLDFFCNPISLSCAHTFCFKCIQNWMLETEGFKLACPLCRESLHISDEILKFQEYMTLDAATANSFLVLSHDLRSVQCGKIRHHLMEGPERFTYMACVLGTPHFSSGCHYWEVEVGKGKEWALGICKESVNRKERCSLSSELGFWIISVEGNAISCSSSPQTRISASPDLDSVGIFIDAEMEEIKFFDVRNDALICTNSQLSSLETLRPFFCPELPGDVTVVPP